MGLYSECCGDTWDKMFTLDEGCSDGIIGICNTCKEYSGFIELEVITKRKGKQ